MLNYTQLSHPWTSYWVQILNSTCCFCGCRICCTKNRLVQSINTFILKARKYWHTLYISRYTLTSGSSSKKGVFIAVTNIENPMRKRNRTVMNFPRSISKLKTIIYYKLGLSQIKSTEPGNDNSPRTKHVMKLQKVQNLDHSKKKWPSKKLISKKNKQY